jgi:hypothetical protein
MGRTYFSAPFVNEKNVPVVSGSISGDKAYLLIRREAKILHGALAILYSRKSVLE